MTQAHLTGQLAMAAPPGAVVKALRDPAVLARLIPGCTGIKTVGPDAWTVHLEKAAGPLTLRLIAHLALVTQGDERHLLLTAKGRSLIAGSVSLDLALTLSQTDGATLLRHDGSVQADGLAGRLLQANDAKLAARSDQLFSRLRELVETSARA